MMRKYYPTSKEVKMALYQNQSINFKLASQGHLRTIKISYSSLQGIITVKLLSSVERAKKSMIKKKIGYKTVATSFMLN